MSLIAESRIHSVAEGRFVTVASHCRAPTAGAAFPTRQRGLAGSRDFPGSRLGIKAQVASPVRGRRPHGERSGRLAEEPDDAQ